MVSPLRMRLASALEPAALAHPHASGAVPRPLRESSRSADASSLATRCGSLQRANKLIRQAQRDDTLPLHIHSFVRSIHWDLKHYI